MKERIGCPITLGEFNRVVKNIAVYDSLNEKQVEWLDQFMSKNKYEFKSVVLKKDEENVLWVIINTHNSVRQFAE